MSRHEVMTRVRDSWQVRRERRAFANVETADKSFRQNGAELRFHSETLKRIFLGIDRQQLAELKQVDPLEFDRLRQKLIRRGEVILAGEIELLGKVVSTQGKVAWHRDPITGVEFDRCFYADVSTHQNSDDAVDVKYVWELGRQQFVAELGLCWLVTDDARFALRAREIMLDWIEQNPQYLGIHWTSSLELAMRSISWIWTLKATFDWDGWSPAELDRIRQSLCEHAEYLANHFSYYSSPYNHLIGEASTLFLLGHLLQDHQHSQHWRDSSRDVLLEHGPRQFYSDGFCVEQATGYHFYTLGFLLLAIHVARQFGKPLTELEPVVQQAAQTAMLFRQPDGRWPAIGDVDSARTFPVDHEDYWDFGSLCRLGSGLFDDAALKSCDAPGDDLFWFLGTEGVERFSQTSTKKLERQLLDESGYAIARDDASWVLFDAGPVAHGLFPDATPSTAHGHADTLQVLYWHRGVPVFVDSGMPFYFGDPEWVNHFRNAESHNTISIAGTQFVRNSTRLAWTHEIPPQGLEVQQTDKHWIAHASWTDGLVTIERQVMLVNGHGLCIADWIQCERPRNITWHWQLAPELEAKLEPTHSLLELTTAHDFSLQVHSSQCEDLNASLVAPIEQSPVGWQSDGYGKRHAGQRLSYSVNDNGVLSLMCVGGRGMRIAVRRRDKSVGAAASDAVVSRPIASFNQFDWFTISEQ